MAAATCIRETIRQPETNTKEPEAMLLKVSKTDPGTLLEMQRIADRDLVEHWILQHSLVPTYGRSSGR